MKKLKHKIKKGSNVVVSVMGASGEYEWVLAKKALGCPRKGKVGEKGHDDILIASSLVVEVNKYEILKPNGSKFEQYVDAQSTFEEDPQPITSCLRTPAGDCERKWCECGTPNGCMKQHK